MAQAKKHSTPKKRPTKRGTAKVPKRTTAPVRSNTLDPVFKLIDDWKVAKAGYLKAVRHFGVVEAPNVRNNILSAARQAVNKAELLESDAAAACLECLVRIKREHGKR